MAGHGHRLPKYLPAGLMPGHPAEPVLYLTELAETRAHILRPDTGDRLTLEWSARAFPYAWVWINQRASRFPWFGRLSSIAVEPVNVWPADGLAAAVARGQAPVLPVHGMWKPPSGNVEAPVGMVVSAQVRDGGEHPYLEAEYRVSAPGPAAQIFSIKAVGIGDETKAARDHRRKPVSDSVR